MCILRYSKMMKIMRLGLHCTKKKLSHGEHSRRKTLEDWRDWKCVCCLLECWHVSAAVSWCTGEWVLYATGVDNITHRHHLQGGRRYVCPDFSWGLVGTDRFPYFLRSVVKRQSKPERFPGYYYLNFEEKNLWKHRRPREWFFPVVGNEGVWRTKNWVF